MDRRARTLVLLVAWSCSVEAVPAPAPVAPPCEPLPELHWPLEGDEGHAWVVNNHVDRDPGEGVRDGWGATGAAARTVNGHAGIDISISSLRKMDTGIAVRAIAGGVVTSVVDEHPDRSTRCEGKPWNLIEILLPSGYLARYGHLARGSAEVSVGDTVVAGQRIGAVGSSGCSEEPHLHLEVRDCSGHLVSPIARGAFGALDPNPSPTLLETFLLDRSVEDGDLDTIKRAGQDMETLPLGRRFALAAAVGNVDPGDTVSVHVYDPAGRRVHALEHRMTTRHELSYWYWNLIAIPPVGTWRVEFRISDGPAGVTRSFEVVEPPPRAVESPTG